MTEHVENVKEKLIMTEEIKQEEVTEEVTTETVVPSVEDVNTNETAEEVETIDAETTEQEEEKYIPYKRFKEINDKYKQLKDELENLKDDSSQSKSESEVVETVVDETKAVEANPLQDKVNQYEAVFNEIFNSKMEQVPESFRDLIPEGDDIAKLAWIESALSKGLFTNNKPQDFGGLGANPVTTVTITREKFMKMSHPEKAKLKQEDENLYNQLLRK